MRISGTLRISVLVFMTACLAIASISFIVAAQSNLPVHDIDTGVSYATIQEALDDNTTLNGHTIQVDAGTYYGTVNVSKAVSLIGEDPLNTIIDGQGEETVVSIHAPSVMITGFTIRNSSPVSGSAGVMVFDSGFCNISENIIMENWYGVWLKSCSNPTLTGNSFLENSNAFYADSVSNGFVSSNDFSQNDFAVWISGAKAMIFQLNNVTGNNYGVWMTKSSNVSLNENLISRNSDGISIYSDSTGVVLSDNMISSNSSYGVFMNGVTDSSIVSNHVISEGKEAFFIQSSSNNDFTGNTAVSSGHDAIFLELSDANLLEGNIVTGSTGAISLSSSSGNVLLSNNLHGNTLGIKVGGSDDNEILENDLLNNTYGISITSSRNVRIEENNLNDNLREGVRLTNSPNAELKGNVISNSIQGIALVESSDALATENDIVKCGTGVFLLGAHNITLLSNNFQNDTVCLALNSSNNNLVHNNSLTGNVDGIRLFQSNNNTVDVNIVSVNFGRAISVSDSDFNVVFHNGFFNNSQMSTSSNSSNMWDSGIEGNFWGYDDLVDSDQDGIVDQPFVLEGVEKDNFPLMTLYRELSTVYESREYVVGIVSNSSVSNLRFGQTGENAAPTVTFLASTVEGTIFCRIGIPHAMVISPFEVTIDNNPVSNQKIVGSNSTHTWLYMLLPQGGDVRIIGAAPAPPFWAEFWFWGIVTLGIVVAVLTSAIFLFYRRLAAYRKNMEEVERKLRERENSPLEVARRMFSSDVERRSVKIGKFEEKYGVRIRPRGSLDEIFRGLEKKNRRGSEEEDEDDS